MSEEPALCVMLECQRVECGLRFPVRLAAGAAPRCPRCRAVTRVVEQARETGPGPAGQPSGPPLHALLDNLRSTLNVGSIFRSADGTGVQRLYLCGITPTPRSPAVAKTSLGAEHTVAWESARSALPLAQRLKETGVQLWALEGTPSAQLVAGAAAAFRELRQTVALVVGNEVCGVDPALLALCDRIIALPMAGQKGSLNVAVAFAVAAYRLRFG